MSEADKVEHDRRVQQFIDKMGLDVANNERARRVEHQQLMDAAKADRDAAAADRAQAAQELAEAKTYKEKVVAHADTVWPGFKEKYYGKV